MRYTRSPVFVIGLRSISDGYQRRRADPSLDSTGVRWRVPTRSMGGRRWRRFRSLSDTKAAEYVAQQVFGREAAGDFPEGFVRCAKVVGEQFRV